MTLIDTSCWIEFLRGKENPASRTVLSLLQAGEAASCDIISVELWSGVRDGAERKALEELERELPSLSLDHEVWSIARTLAFRCRRAGLNARVPDLMISACAIRHDVPVESIDTDFAAILAVARKM